MIQTWGLILDIAGAILLFISTEMMNSIILGLISYSASASNTKIGRSSKIINIIKKDKNKASWFSRIGLILLILGFLLQLLSNYVK